MADAEAMRVWMKEFMGIDVDADAPGGAAPGAPPGGPGNASRLIADPVKAASDAIHTAVSTIASAAPALKTGLDKAAEDLVSAVALLEQSTGQNLVFLKNNEDEMDKKSFGFGPVAQIGLAATGYVIGEIGDLVSKDDTGRYMKSDAIKDFDTAKDAMAIGKHHERLSKRHHDIAKIGDLWKRKQAYEALDAEIRKYLFEIPAKRREAKDQEEHQRLLDVIEKESKETKWLYDEDITKFDQSIDMRLTAMAQKCELATKIDLPGAESFHGALAAAQQSIAAANAISNPAKRWDAKRQLAENPGGTFSVYLGAASWSAMSDAELLKAPEWLVRVHLSASGRWQAPYEPPPEPLTEPFWTRNRQGHRPSHHHSVDPAETPPPGQDDLVRQRLNSFRWFEEGKPPFDEAIMDSIRWAVQRND